jgi:hypothetical protein
MAYSVYVNHPETWTRQQEDFTSWNYWAEDNAPWTGVGINEQARILQAVCSEAPGEVCDALNTGGDLDAKAAREVLRRAEAVMGTDTREVFQRAVRDGYGVRVVFSQALGSAVSASAYLAKFGSD